MKKLIFVFICILCSCLCLTACDINSIIPSLPEQNQKDNNGQKNNLNISSLKIDGPFNLENSQYKRLDIKNISGRALYNTLITIGFYKGENLAFTRQSGVHLRIQQNEIVNFFIIDPESLDGVTEIKIDHAIENWSEAL